MKVSAIVGPRRVLSIAFTKKTMVTITTFGVNVPIGRANRSLNVRVFMILVFVVIRISRKAF